jgi:hypothetical protein
MDPTQGDAPPDGVGDCDELSGNLDPEGHPVVGEGLSLSLKIDKHNDFLLETSGMEARTPADEILQVRASLYIYLLPNWQVDVL